jgi:hypothetical protein
MALRAPREEFREVDGLLQLQRTNPGISGSLAAKVWIQQERSVC